MRVVPWCRGTPSPQNPAVAWIPAETWPTEEYKGRSSWQRRRRNVSGALYKTWRQGTALGNNHRILHDVWRRNLEDITSNTNKLQYNWWLLNLCERYWYTWATKQNLDLLIWISADSQVSKMSRTTCSLNMEIHHINQYQFVVVLIGTFTVLSRYNLWIMVDYTWLL